MLAKSGAGSKRIPKVANEYGLKYEETDNLFSSDRWTDTKRAPDGNVPVSKQGVPGSPGRLFHGVLRRPLNRCDDQWVRGPRGVMSDPASCWLPS